MGNCSLQYVCNLFAPFAFAEFAYHWSVADTKTGMNIFNLFTFTSEYHVPLGLVMLCVDLLLYTLLAMYLEKVIPSMSMFDTSDVLILL